MSCQMSCKAGDARTVPVAVESSAEFARTRHWARGMAHKHTTRGDGYERWDFKDGSVLIRQSNGVLVTR